MPTVPFTPALRNEYQALFDACQVKPEKVAEVEQLTTRLISNKSRYEAAGDPLDIPWQLVAVIHNMESSQSFMAHLHNGDPLTARTTHVPIGRPADGDPPFTWEASAVDALTLEGFAAWSDWSIPGLLYCTERFNGWGYRLHHPEVKSPYLWSFSNQYVSGKYVADGTWSSTAVSKQCGTATLLRRLAEKGELDAPPHSMGVGSFASLRYAPKKVTPGGVELQRFLNSFPGIYLKEDGKLGPRTSDAFMRVFDVHLAGDPRE